MNDIKKIIVEYKNMMVEILGIKYNIPELEARQWIKDFNFDEVCRSCNYVALHDDHEVWVDAIYQFKVGE